VANKLWYVARGGTECLWNKANAVKRNENHSSSAVSSHKAIIYTFQSSESQNWSFQCYRQVKHFGPHIQILGAAGIFVTVKRKYVAILSKDSYVSNSVLNKATFSTQYWKDYWFEGQWQFVKAASFVAAKLLYFRWDAWNAIHSF